MNDINMKLVEFDKYCPTCVHSKVNEGEEPCVSCLDECAREYSHKPIKYVEAERKKDIKKPVRKEVVDVE